MNLLIGIIGFLLIIVGIVFTVISVMSGLKQLKNERRYADENRPAPKLKFNKLPVFVAILGIALIVLSSCFMVVPTGYTGVRTTFGLIDQESCMPGFNPLVPYVQQISLVNNKQQDLRFEDRVWSETKEQTVVYMEGTVVSYQIVPESSAWIYANVENWVEELVDKDIVSSALKSASRTLGADIVTDRATIEPLAKQTLQAAVDSKYGENRVIIKNVIINNMDFEDSYNEAIAKKSQALQEQQEKDIRNQTDINEAIAIAETQRQLAQGEADAEIIRANAKAEANQIISKSITAATQRQDAIDKWNGEMPRYTGSGASFGILDITDIPAASND